MPRVMPTRVPGRGPLAQNRGIPTRGPAVYPRLPRSTARPFRALALATGLALLAPALAAPPAPAKPRTMGEILEASQPGDWRPLDPARTLYMELPNGRVVIELAPDFAPAHVANIIAMAKGGYFDGLSINRSQDNFVVQWGDAAEEESARKPFPAGVKDKLPAEFERPAAGLPFTRLPDADGWAPQVGFSDGFAVARAPREGKAWLAHCYGVVGAGRNNEADSSTGAELYVVTGQSPRQLDRNITTVGRVVKGMELLSTVPRGTGPLGFFTEPSQRVTIRAIRLASDVPQAERTPIEVLRTDTPLFTELVEARRNRRDDFYKRPAGHIDVCNVPQPVREPPVK